MKTIIFFEGIRGSGKSTLAKAFHDHITPKPKEIEYVRINTILDALSLAIQYTAKFKPLFLKAANSKDAITIFDRGLLSTLIYQGAKCGIEDTANVIHAFTSNALNECRVITVFIDMQPEIAYARYVDRSIKCEIMKAVENNRKRFMGGNEDPLMLVEQLPSLSSFQSRALLFKEHYTRQLFNCKEHHTIHIQEDCVEDRLRLLCDSMTTIGVELKVKKTKKTESPSAPQMG